MKKAVGIALIGAGAVIIGGVAYRNSVQSLRFTIWDITVTNTGAIGLMIRVYNPHGFFGFPVPGLFFNVFDADSNYLGSLRADNLQWISANGFSFIYAWLLPNYLELGSILKNLLLPDNQNQLILNGEIFIKNFRVPIETVLATKN